MRNGIARCVAVALWTLSATCIAAQIACPVNTNPACAPGFPVEFAGPGVPSDIGYVQFSSPAIARLGLVADTRRVSLSARRPGMPPTTATALSVGAQDWNGCPCRARQ